jgi:hypothetical protein
LKGGGLQRGGHWASVLDEPEVKLGVVAGPVAQRPGQAEDEVVPRLVCEEKPRGLVEEVHWIREPPDFHRAMV